MPSVGFEPAIPASERPQTYALDRAATGTGNLGHGTQYWNNEISSPHTHLVKLISKLQPEDGPPIGPKHVVVFPLYSVKYSCVRLYV